MSDSGNKVWYYHDGKKNVGPSTQEEISRHIKKGTISGETYTWREGMANWKRAKDVSELESLFDSSSSSPPPLPGTPATSANPVSEKKSSSPSSSTSSGELSGLRDLNPEEVRDETGSMNAKMLRSAKKEALKVKGKLLSESIGEGVAERKKYLAGVVLGMVLLGIGITYAFQSSELALGAKMSQIWGRIASPLPVLANVEYTDYSDLKRAVQAKWEQSGPQVAMAVSEEKDAPRVVAAGNLPSGISLRLHLTSAQTTGRRGVYLQLPLVMNGKLATSEPVRLVDGSPLPVGNYLLILVEDEDQSEEIGKTLTSLPPAKYRPSQFLSPGKKIFTSKLWTVTAPEAGESSKKVSREGQKSN